MGFLKFDGNRFIELLNMAPTTGFISTGGVEIRSKFFEILTDDFAVTIENELL